MNTFHLQILTMDGREYNDEAAGVMLRSIHGDIAILLRSPGKTGVIYREALINEGVPVGSAQGSGFFTAPEIALTLAMLNDFAKTIQALGENVKLGDLRCKESL